MTSAAPTTGERGRALADDGLPYNGEIKQTSSVSASGAAIESPTYDLHEWSEAELNEWKALGESHLHGFD